MTAAEKFFPSTRAAALISLHLGSLGSWYMSSESALTAVWKSRSEYAMRALICAGCTRCKKPWRRRAGAEPLAAEHSTGCTTSPGGAAPLWCLQAYIYTHPGCYSTGCWRAIERCTWCVVTATLDIALLDGPARSASTSARPLMAVSLTIFFEPGSWGRAASLTLMRALVDQTRGARVRLRRQRSKHGAEPARIAHDASRPVFKDSHTSKSLIICCRASSSAVAFAAAS